MAQSPDRREGLSHRRLVDTIHQLDSAVGLGVLATAGASAVPVGSSGTAELVAA